MIEPVPEWIVWVLTGNAAIWWLVLLLMSHGDRAKSGSVLLTFIFFVVNAVSVFMIQ